MRATNEDFQKVIDVAREQITSALKTSPMTMDEFKRNLKTYSAIQESRNKEAKNRGEREGKAVQHLKESIVPEIKGLIQQQRMRFLIAGTRFNRPKNKGDSQGGSRSQVHICRLSQNQKSLHYTTEWNNIVGGGENVTGLPLHDHLPKKLPVSEIKDFVFASNPAHLAKDKRKGAAADNQLTFSILRDNGDSLDFMAPNAATFDYWCDGINALLRKDMESAKAAEDLTMLLTMEVKIRLLELEGIDIPDDPPPVPPLPPNFDFSQEVQ